MQASRSALIQGIREMCDFLDQNEDVPFPAYVWEKFHFGDWVGEDRIKEIAHAASFRKVYEGDTFRLVRSFGPEECIEISFSVNREAVCSPKTTRIETVDEPDADWLRDEIKKLRERQPTKAVERTVVEEWDCHPLLAPSTDQ